MFILPNANIETGADSMGLFNTLTIFLSGKVWICEGDATQCSYLDMIKKL